MKPKFERGLLIPQMTLPENKKISKICGIPFILKDGKVDYGIIYDKNYVYFVIPKRLTKNGYTSYRRQLKPRSLYMALKRNNNTILEIVAMIDTRYLLLTDY